MFENHMKSLILVHCERSEQPFIPIYKQIYLILKRLLASLAYCEGDIFGDLQTLCRKDRIRQLEKCREKFL